MMTYRKNSVTIRRFGSCLTGERIQIELNGQVKL